MAPLSTTEDLRRDPQQTDRLLPRLHRGQGAQILKMERVNRPCDSSQNTLCHCSILGHYNLFLFQFVRCVQNVTRKIPHCELNVVDYNTKPRKYVQVTVYNLPLKSFLCKHPAQTLARALHRLQPVYKSTYPCRIPGRARLRKSSERGGGSPPALSAVRICGRPVKDP